MILGGKGEYSPHLILQSGMSVTLEAAHWVAVDFVQSLPKREGSRA